MSALIYGQTSSTPVTISLPDPTNQYSSYILGYSYSPIQFPPPSHDLTIDMNGNNLYVSDSGHLYIGADSGFDQSLTLVGPGTATLAGSDGGGGTVNIGTAAAGSLVLDGSTFFQDGILPLFTVGSTGSLLIENGGNIEGGDREGTFNITNAVLNDGSMVAPQLTLDNSTLIHGSSIVYNTSANLGNVTVDHSTLMAEIDSLAPMQVSGPVTVSNGSTFGGGNISVYGTLNLLAGSTLYGFLAVPGGTLNVQLGPDFNTPLVPGVSLYFDGFNGQGPGGTLELTLADGFSPTIGEKFDLFSPADYYSGTFATIDLPPLESGGGWDTSQLYTTGIVSVVPEPASTSILLAAPAASLLRRRSRR